MIKIKLNKDYILSIIAVILGLIAGGILMLLTKNDPFQGFYYLFRGGVMNIERFGNTLATATTLIFTGLSVAFAFRTGLFNIGAAGQMLMGGLAAIAIALTFDLPRPLLLLLMIIFATLAGALWGGISGMLKARYNVNEVVSTIMLNWIAYWTVYYVIPGYFKGQFLETESRRIPREASMRIDWLSDLFNGSYVNLGFFLAIIATIIVGFILNRTTLGFELKATGFNRQAAEASGINVKRNIVISMMIAGGLAGLGGATLYTGYASNMQIGVLPVQGFDGIAVALLGATAPLGVFVAAIFFGIMHAGKGFMSAMTSVPPEISDTIIATIIYFAATSIAIERIWNHYMRKRKARKEGAR